MTREEFSSRIEKWKEEGRNLEMNYIQENVPFEKGEVVTLKGNPYNRYKFMSAQLSSDNGGIACLIAPFDKNKHNHQYVDLEDIMKCNDDTVFPMIEKNYFSIEYGNCAIITHITNIVKYDDVSEFQKHIFEVAKTTYPGIYKEEQKFFVYGVTYYEDIPKVQIYAEGKDNKWYGIGEMNPLIPDKLFTQHCFGILDIDGELAKSCINYGRN